MRLMTTRLRGLLIALVVLALSATVAFAGKIMPAAAEHGLTTASEAAGFTVPVGAGDETDDDEVDENADEPDADEPDADDGEEGDAEEGDAEEGDFATHGEMVSAAAHMDLPKAFAADELNRGAFIRCVARMNHGHEAEDAAPITMATLEALTPQLCNGDDEELTEGDEDVTAASAKGKDKHEAKVKGGKGKGKNKNR